MGPELCLPYPELRLWRFLAIVVHPDRNRKSANTYAKAEDSAVGSETGEGCWTAVERWK